jgi:hypothetical protein
MTEREFVLMWGDVDIDLLPDEIFEQFKNDCFEMYEETGFIEKFNSPYDVEREHNGMKFDVLRRATTDEVDMESMPVWKIKFENGDIAYCYPEEICKVEHKDK